MLLSILSFITGIIIVQQLEVLPETEWLFSLLFLIAVLFFFRFWRLMFFVIGLLWAIGFASIRIADRLPEHLQGQHLQIEGQVIGLPQQNEKRVRFDFKVINAKHSLPEKLRLSWYFPQQQIKSGQTWQFTVKLKKPHGQFNPQAFDYEKWLFIQNIGATGYVRNKPKPLLLASASDWQSINSIRQLISDNLEQFLGNSPFRGIVKALTIGDRQNITQKQWQVFRKTGVVHLLAISGLHIGLIAGLTYFLMLKLATRVVGISPHLAAAISAVMVAFFYSALAGFSIPTQRALIMLTIAMTAIVWQRNVSTVNTLALTLFAVLIFDPFSVLSAGFWLSFSAVALIVYCLSARLAKPGYWLGAIKVHWITALGLSPLLVLYFQQFSVISPVANFFTVPVVSLLIVPLCLLAVLLMFVLPEFAGYLFFIINNFLQGLWRLLSVLAEQPFSTVTLTSASVYSLLLAILGIFILLAPKGMPSRWLGLILLLPLSFSYIDKPEIGDVDMTLLDVGQGLSAVIETTNHVLVFDTGAKYSQNYDMGDAVVIPFLKSKSISTVNVLLISHGDNDHIGGAKSVIKQLKVDKVLTSVPDKLEQHGAIECQAGQAWEWDQVEFEILSPKIDGFEGENNNSCVLKVKTQKGRGLLLTGDIEQQAEVWLVKNYEKKLISDILIAPHHGSKTSSSLTFLNQVKPSMILIPLGFKNRFSFPHQEVMERYKNIGATVFNTAEQGALIVKIENDRYSVVSLRIQNGKYWN